MEAPSWTGRHIQVHSCTLDKRSQRPLLIPTRETTEKNGVQGCCSSSERRRKRSKSCCAH